ncbi:MAG: hypothetical protein J6W19_06510 [Prevotella sp.]|nr:hypothetical protein [Prevotella sp.]
MRRTAYKTIAKQLLMFVAIAGGLASCASEEWQFENPQQYNHALSIVPTVFNAATTRAETVPAEDQLNENLLVSLDVFVANAGQDDIINQWHLTTPSSTIESTVKSLLVNYWEKRTNLRKNNSYDVYVAANNEATKATIATVTDLKALSVTDADIIKKYKVDAGTSSDSPFTPEKVFVMDGAIKNWTADNDADEQVFEVDMKRAAAKIQLNVSFDQDFLDRLIYRYDKEQYENDGTLVWTDADGNRLADGAEKVLKDEHDQIHVTGTPAWRYVNFSKSAPIFTEGELDAETEQGKRIFRQNMFFNALNSIEGEDKRFSITTYSYPMAWEKSLAINDAPFIMISVRFDEWDETDGEGEWKANYYYYRIPVCDENIVTSLDRNKIYIVNAIIDSYGSVGDNVEQDVTLEYEVMDWRNDDADNSNVIGKPLDFLMVSPLHFNLYGDGAESVTLDAHSPNGKRVLVKDVVVTWIDASGQERHDKVNDLQTVPGEATDGKITVSSTVMPNHAVKTITFTVYLEGHENDMAHTVTIKHFPVENIQNFAGSWSSKIGGTAYEYRNSNANGYIQLGEISKTSPGFLYQKTSVQISQSQYTLFQNEGYDVSRSGNGWFGYTYYLNDYWIVYARLANRQWIDWEADQTVHNTQKGCQDDNFKAKMFNPSDGLIYPIYDNSTNNNNTRFAATITATVPRSMSGLTNNHMYVVQISSTSDKYILGKPILTKGAYNGTNTQSNDDVVSPAFMIASQLGAVSTFTGNDAALNAAIHCSNYLEVGTDGTRYTGWRLPTASEIAVIADRQNDPNYNPDVITEVLGGDYYYNLAGGRSFVIGKDQNSENTYVRCVRDLTDADLKRINGE